MKELEKILAPTDLSETSLAGVRYALELAHADGAEVILFHVIGVAEEWFAVPRHAEPVRELLEAEARRLDRFLRQNFANLAGLVEIRQKVEFGHPAVNIVEAAEREAVDMIVMSTHGRTGIDHMIMGSVAEKVVARAPCPVLTIPPLGRAGGRAKAA
jgi:nucleotide-binding universal stress UspA family protein